MKFNIKEIFCKHSRTGKVRQYYGDVKYNEIFKTVQAIEYSYKYCLNCGKKIETPIVKWVTLKGIEKEIIDDYERNLKSKII